MNKNTKMSKSQYIFSLTLIPTTQWRTQEFWMGREDWTFFPTKYLLSLAL